MEYTLSQNVVLFVTITGCDTSIGTGYAFVPLLLVKHKENFTFI